MSFAHVALPIPLRQTFVYRVPGDLAARARPGAHVAVKFRGRIERGWIVELARESERADALAIERVLESPPVTPHLLALARWVAEYYVAPVGMALAATLPGGVEGFERSRARKRAAEDPVLAMALPERRALTADQRAALEAILPAVKSGGFQPFLLHGVTASGKTEVYLRAVAAARDAGGQALVLVPEVALGSQIVRLFEQRFRGRVGVLHSYLGVGERRRNWELASRGALDVVVGARSAVFAPLPNLRLVVVDEEHEPAYKQSEQLRYHGRDVAVRRAQMLGLPIVLGSATPSLESLANAARGRYRRLSMPKRVDGRPLPRVHVVDLRRERAGDSLVSPALGAALGERLARGEQAMLFLNRRGHSHYSQCRACGWVAECEHCDIALTLHLEPLEWRCHYCDTRTPARRECPKCRAALLRFSGSGTQRAERELAASFPKARVLRLDTDVARRRTSPGEIVAAFARGDADVLVGTQMIAKGLDFPRVTLVGVLDADVALHLPDFRASERTLQLLQQVSGRAGRGAVAGEVLVQTCTPDHPAIAAFVTGETRAFLERELELRREAGYPPFRRIATLLFSGPDASEVDALAGATADALRASPAGASVDVLGPAPQALARLRGQHRRHVLGKGAHAGPLRAALEAALAAAESGGRRAKARVAVDVDPVDVL